jgi:acyl-coenzyme A thioesterase PaaI-like protein
MDDEAFEAAAADLSMSRLERLHALDLTPRRAELHRLAAANRTVIERLVSTTATVEQLAEAADALEAVADLLGSMPSGHSYEGFSEAANAGSALTQQSRSMMSAGAGQDGDESEAFAFFDHSPFIGLSNPMSPPIDLRYRDDRVEGTVTFGVAYEGPPGCVHGGYVAAAFDELLGATQSLSGSAGMTARLIVNYRSPTPLRTELRLEGELTGRDGRKITTAGRIFAGDTLCAEAEGLFISFDSERFRALLESRIERFG